MHRIASTPTIQPVVPNRPVHSSTHQHNSNIFSLNEPSRYGPSRSSFNNNHTNAASTPHPSHHLNPSTSLTTASTPSDKQTHNNEFPTVDSFSEVFLLPETSSITSPPNYRSVLRRRPVSDDVLGIGPINPVPTSPKINVPTQGEIAPTTHQPYDGTANATSALAQPYTR